MATPTYTPIEAKTLGSASATVTFSSIPSTYTDLVLIGNPIVSASLDYKWYVNGDNTSGLYSNTRLSGNGSSAISSRTPNANFVYFDGTAPASGSSQNFIMNFQNYANTSVYKTVFVRYNDSGNETSARVALWRNTNAINSITISTDSSTFAIGSTFTLYGIANAAIGAPKATGGIITYDNTYYYHTFGASGTFTPQQNLTNVDYLVIAGGGSGGGTIGYSGGGGAGGLRSTVDATGGGGSLESKLSLTSGTAYTITVGAGGSPGSGGSNSSIAGSGLTTITSVGGGCAGFYNGSVYVNPTSGGSGGGGSASGSGSSTIGGAGTANQGYAGGTSSGSAASGGGGAASVGGNGSTGVAGIGGSALTLTTFATVTGTGVNNKYAGGGGAIVNSQNIQSVGGGGGAGNGNYAGTGVSATANTGSGGGGGSSNGGSGGSGVVVIRYAKA